jgi:protein SCO1/2
MCSKSGNYSLRFLLFAAGALTVSACATHHQARGVVLRVDHAARTVVVSHEPVPDFMDAMVMPFELRHPSEMADLVAGDRIAFRIASHKGQTRIDRLRILSAAPPGAGPIAPGSTAAAGVGNVVADFSLTSHHGGVVSLSSLRGKVVAVAFIYTRCPLPDYCPRMMTNFLAVKQRFAAKLNRDVVLLTVTFDPQYDSVETLRQYARRYGAEDEGWHFLTGAKADVARVCELFGVEFWPEEGLITHTLRTAVVDREGRLAATLEGKDYSGKQLGDLLETVLVK